MVTLEEAIKQMVVQFVGMRRNNRTETHLAFIFQKIILYSNVFLTCLDINNRHVQLPIESGLNLNILNLIIGSTNKIIEPFNKKKEFCFCHQDYTTLLKAVKSIPINFPKIDELFFKMCLAYG